MARVATLTPRPARPRRRRLRREQQRQRGLVEQQRLVGPEDELEQLERRHRRARRARARAVTIKMQSIQFAPKTQAVKVGQTVSWVNEDGVDHNVTAQSGATFKSNDFGQGGTYTFKPTKAGTIAYVCTIHPGMTGTLNVTG